MNRPRLRKHDELKYNLNKRQGEVQVERRWEQGSANESDVRQVWAGAQEHRREAEHWEYR